MKIEKSRIALINEKSKKPRTIKDIEDTLKEMDKIHNTSFYNWIKDENNASVIAFKTKDLFQEHYEKQPELVYNALRFLCKDWKLSKIAELILKLFYNGNVASKKLAIIIYEVSLLLENHEKIDLISLLLIGEEAGNVAFFLYHFFQYTEKKYREHVDAETLNEEEFLDEMNAFCSEVLECLYSCLKWNNEYFKELIIEYINLSTLEIDARHEFLIHMVNIKYSHFQQELLLNKKESILQYKENKIDSTLDNETSKQDDTDEVFKKSLNFGILIFNMYLIVMRTKVEELLTETSLKKENSNVEISMDMDEDILSDNSMSINDSSNSKRMMLRKDEDDDDGITENGLFNISRIKSKNESIKKEESSSTSSTSSPSTSSSSSSIWIDGNEVCSNCNSHNNNDHISIMMNDDIDNNEGNSSKDMSQIYNFGWDSSYCKNTNESGLTPENETLNENVNENEKEKEKENLNENENYNSMEESTSEGLDEFSYHFEELFNESFNLCDNDDHHHMKEDENEEDESIINELDLLDDFINKSFTSTNFNARRNSTLSFASFINDYNMEEGYNRASNSNTLMDSSSSRRNSRYSLNLSVHSISSPSLSPSPSSSSCRDLNNYDERLIPSNLNSNMTMTTITTTSNSSSNTTSHCNCGCHCRYNNFSENLLYVFPSPPPSPILSSVPSPSSPLIRLNEGGSEFDPHS
jgi:hypothetical protein